jgi:hypothetical protein
MSDSSLKAIRDELQAINDDAYGGAHPFVRYR